VALVGEEAGERARGGVDLLATGAERDRAVDDDDPRMLLHLVVAELLAGLEADEHGAGLVVAPQDDRGAAASGRIDVGQTPALHPQPV
jgi:hypothetical protein